MNWRDVFCGPMVFNHIQSWFRCSVFRRLLSLAVLGSTHLCFAGEHFRVATYNLESYLDAAVDSRPAKSEASRAQVRASILALQPDVIALQEMGTISALKELQGSLKAGGLELPYWEHLTGSDTNIHVAVLSRFPFAARHPHTNETFLLGGRHHHVSRAFAELDICVNSNYCFTLLTAHLKSRRTVPQADEEEMRTEEARLLREKADAVLSARPEANLVLLGDFNDTPDSRAIRTLIGRGKKKLLDTRPAERNECDSGQRGDARPVCWTHFYAKEDTYSRIDYILLSPGMSKEWVARESYVLARTGWGMASDHRPVVAAFEAADK
jgi:endonuclease/exonuclease/phosphatase family metal-dependent hydrolase